MLALELIAERKIAEAIGRGELADLPGQGRPLDLDDDPLIPEDVRVAYRILKNAGYVPPEVESLRTFATLERLVDETPDGEQRRMAIRKLELLRMQLEKATPGCASSTRQQRYRSRLLGRLGVPR